jgi:RIO kinase 1
LSSWSIDELEAFENRFDPARSGRKARKQRKPESKNKKRQALVVETIEATPDVEEVQMMTYSPSKYEGSWLLSSLQPFFDQGLITDVLGLVKGGKEASVYRCAADPQTGHSLVAAKVYRPRQFRQLRNDKMYREGRAVLNENGRVVKGSDTRIMRALNKKSEFGVQVAHTSWLMYEYTTLQQLYALGAAVPQPFASGENAILMGYYGDAQMAAPALYQVNLDLQTARAVFERVMGNIELMLAHGMIHGDLSAYNILYWDDHAVLIDFPQVTNSATNAQAYSIFERDVARVCEYFVGRGLKLNSRVIAAALWAKHRPKRDVDIMADLSALLDDDDEV